MHDMAESITGDLTPHDGVSKEEKHRREAVGYENLPVNQICFNPAIFRFIAEAKWIAVCKVIGCRG